MERRLVELLPRLNPDVIWEIHEMIGFEDRLMEHLLEPRDDHGMALRPVSYYSEMRLLPGEALLVEEDELLRQCVEIRHGSRQFRVRIIRSLYLGLGFGDLRWSYRGQIFEHDHLLRSWSHPSSQDHLLNGAGEGYHDQWEDIPSSPSRILNDARVFLSSLL